MGKAAACVRCGIEHGALVPCDECGVLHHANCFEQIGRCAVPSCTGKKLKGATPEVPAPAVPGSAAPAGAEPVFDGERFAIDFTSHREGAMMWGAHGCAAVTLLVGALGGSQEAFLGWFAVTIGAYLLRGQIEDRWVIDGRAKAVLLESRTFGMASATPFAAFKDLSDLTLIQAAGYRHIEDPMTLENAMELVAGLRLKPLRRPYSNWSTDSKLELDWRLSLGVVDGRRIDLWWPVENQLKPTDELLAVARLLEKITGLKLQVRVAPPRPS